MTAGISRSHERPNAEIDERASRLQSNAGAGAYVAAFSRTRLFVGYRYADVDYADGKQFRGIELADQLNGTSDAVNFGADIELTPLTSFAAHGESSQERFDVSTDRDADSYRFGGTVTFNPLALISGRASVGVRAFRPLGPEMQDFTGLTAAVALAYAYRDRTRFGVTFDRDLRYSFAELTPYYVATGSRVTVTHRIYGNVDGQVLAGFERLDYEARLDASAVNDVEDDTDSIRAVGGGLGYRLSDGSRFGVNVDYSTRASSTDERENSRARRVRHADLRILTMLLLATLFTLLTYGGAQGSSVAPPADYVVGPQDVLNIAVFGEGDLTKTVTLDADGTFDYPFIGRVKASGLTARRTSEEISSRLKKYFVNPQVSVEVVKFRSQRVIVMGYVHAPGQYPLAGTMSVLEVVAAAGSPTAAAGSYVTILRPSGNLPRLPQAEAGGGSSLRLTMKELQGGQVPEGFSLRDGDTITVPKAETVTVIGHVKTTGPVILDGEMTVMQVIGLAGGVTEKGALNRVRIHRTIDGKMQEVKGVKLSDVVKPGDTIEVPQRYF